MRVTNFPSAWATGKYMDSMPSKKTLLSPSTPSLTQRSSNLPDAVPSQRRRLALVVVGQQDAGTDQNLKAVADAEDQFAGRLELDQRFLQVMANLIAEDSSRRDVVAVAEAAGQAEDLVLTRQATDSRAAD